METIFTDSKDTVVYKTEAATGTHEMEHGTFHRHMLLKGYDQKTLSSAQISLVGAGGLGSEIGMALVRKGIGELNIYDSDSVELSNLSRQFYYKRDLYKAKACCLAKNLADLAPGKTCIRGIPMLIQEGVDTNTVFKTRIAIVGVDNNDARFYCSNHFKDIPVVFTAVSPEADSGYVFIQEPGGPCFGCMFGDQYGRPAKRCTGSTIDINKVVAGIVSYAVDTLLMQRERDWNYKRIHFHGPFKDFSEKVPPAEGCEFCRPGEIKKH